MLKLCLGVGACLEGSLLVGVGEGLDGLIFIFIDDYGHFLFAELEELGGGVSNDDGGGGESHQEGGTNDKC